MAIEIPSNLTPELVPFSWLLGTWEGTGTIWYKEQEKTPFGQIITFTQDGLPYLEYRAESFLLDDSGQKLRPITIETGFWQIDRPLTDADGGFGLVPKDIVPAFADAESVETLRNEDDGFNLIATIAHPGGISENYVGMVKGPVVRMQTANLIRDDISHRFGAPVGAGERQPHVGLGDRRRRREPAQARLRRTAKNLIHVRRFAGHRHVWFPRRRRRRRLRRKLGLRHTA